MTSNLPLPVLAAQLIVAQGGRKGEWAGQAHPARSDIIRG